MEDGKNKDGVGENLVIDEIGKNKKKKDEGKRKLISEMKNMREKEKIKFEKFKILDKLKRGDWNKKIKIGDLGFDIV